MSDGLGLLDDEDVRRLVRLIETLDKSDFDFLEFKVGGAEVILGTGGSPGGEHTSDLVYSPAAVSASSAPAAPEIAAAPAVRPEPTNGSESPSVATSTPDAVSLGEAIVSGGAEVVAPLMGVFYAQPEPGAEPFVTVGSEVKADTTVALIEVMKTFAPVQAGIDGTVVEICVIDSQFVEYGQTLLRIEPATQKV